MFFIFSNFVIQVYADSARIYPSKYVVTIKNVQKEDIKKIDIIYKTDCRFAYQTDDYYRSWLGKTDFGYKYKDYTDAEIIPTLSTEEIDEIAFLYTG